MVLFYVFYSVQCCRTLSCQRSLAFLSSRSVGGQNYNVHVLIWVTNLEVRKLSGTLDKQMASPVQSPGAAFTPSWYSPNSAFCSWPLPARGWSAEKRYPAGVVILQLQDYEYPQLYLLGAWRIVFLNLFQKFVGKESQFFIWEQLAKVHL